MKSLTESLNNKINESLSSADKTVIEYLAYKGGDSDDIYTIFDLIDDEKKFNLDRLDDKDFQKELAKSIKDLLIHRYEEKHQDDED